jgi:hypothetical protein
MPSISTLLTGLVALAPLVAAVPAEYGRREMPSMAMSPPPAITESAGPATSSAPAAKAEAAAAGGIKKGDLSDVDILNL